jgi:hypothetical protein
VAHNAEAPACDGVFQANVTADRRGTMRILHPTVTQMLPLRPPPSLLGGDDDPRREDSRPPRGRRRRAK